MLSADLFSPKLRSKEMPPSTRPNTHVLVTNDTKNKGSVRCSQHRSRATRGAAHPLPPTAFVPPTRRAPTPRCHTTCDGDLEWRAMRDLIGIDKKKNLQKPPVKRHAAFHEAKHTHMYNHVQGCDTTHGRAGHTQNKGVFPTTRGSQHRCQIARPPGARHILSLPPTIAPPRPIPDPTLPTICVGDLRRRPHRCPQPGPIVAWLSPSLSRDWPWERIIALSRHVLL